MSELQTAPCYKWRLLAQIRFLHHEHGYYCYYEFCVLKSRSMALLPQNHTTSGILIFAFFLKFGQMLSLVNVSDLFFSFLDSSFMSQSSYIREDTHTHTLTFIYIHIYLIRSSCAGQRIEWHEPINEPQSIFRIKCLYFDFKRSKGYFSCRLAARQSMRQW